MRFTIRVKLLIFALVLALIPLGIAGQSMIRITQDELKSSTNEELSYVAAKLAQDIDALYFDIWKAPLLLIRNAVDNKDLDLTQKASMLTNGTKNVPDIVAIQITLEGIPRPLLVSQDAFTELISSKGLDPKSVLKVDADDFPEEMPESGSIGGLTYVDKIDKWLMTIYLPLEQKIQNRNATLVARVNLDNLKKTIESMTTGTQKINIVEANGKRIFDSERTDISDWAVVQEVKSLIESDSRTSVVNQYKRPTGEQMLSAFSFPTYFDWGVIVEENIKDAYVVISVMFKQLLIWISIGFLVAVGAGVFGSTTLSKPIIAIGKVAQIIGTGNLNITVDSKVVNQRDEIGDLGKRMNEMIEGLRERFHLTKFVSDQTVHAIKRGGEEGITLGGERRKATVFFSDIRGFTAFSEKVEPEVVIAMINTYLSAQAKIVQKFHGDIDKYVGDELVAVFQGDEMVANATNAAREIQQKIKELNVEYPEFDRYVGIGINTGDMVMGAMGSEDRMDYTILGDNVNLGARLCSAAKGGEVLLSSKSYEYVKDDDQFEFTELEPISVKGKVEPIKIYGVKID